MMMRSLFTILLASAVAWGPTILTNTLSSQTTDYDESLYEALEYRLVGPFRGGRSCTVHGVVGDRDLYYFGSVGGGVWRTDDGGRTYENISDGYFGGSVGSIEIAESDQNVIYCGLGEKTVRGNVSSNFGVWKSLDGGDTWNFIGLEGTRHIGRIRVHPQNPDVVYVAAMGDLWKPSEERGVFKSTDGGETWEKVLYVSEDAGAVDLILDPSNPRTIYASTWNVRRTPYGFSSGGPGSDLWKSTDAGASWTKLTGSEDLPAAPRGIIGIAVSPVNPDRVYALVEAEDGGLYRSDDAGLTWEKTSRNRALRSRAWYYTRVYADSQDEDLVYVMNVSYAKSKDGGYNFTLHNAPHGDHHDLWIDPLDNQRMIIADDGGAQISTDGGTTWSTYYNQPTAQFYRIATDDVFPYRIYGAQQDNSAIRIYHRGSGNGITEDDWEVTAGGESASHAIDPKDPDIVYGGTYKGYMYRYDHKTKQRRAINVWPLNPAGSGVEVMKYRFNWNFPVAISMHEPEKVLVFSNHVHVTTTEGQSWETVSPDLTRNKPETLVSSGGPITQDNTGVEYYANIFTQMESPHEKGVWWTGSDDGLIHITRDGFETWTNVTPPQAPGWIMWNSIDPHPTDPGGAYVAGTQYKSGDFTPYLYKTTDYGKTWTEITTGIDEMHFTRVVRSDPDREGLLYAGTEYGMYISFDDGANWKPFQLNLPEVPVTDLHVKDNNLIVATQGRSFWIIDDLTVLHQLSDEVADSDHHLYKPKPSYRMRQGGWGGYNKLLEGQNHPNGVMFHYYFKDDLDSNETAELRITETDGDLIKSYKSGRGGRLKDVAGSHRFVWNLRYADATSFDGLVLYASNTRGPRAVPGAYIAELIVGQDTVRQEFEILMDPRIETSQEDLQAQFDFLISVRDKLSETHQAVIDIRSMREDIKFLKGKLAGSEGTNEIISSLNEIDEEMTVIENELHETRNEARQDPLNFGIKLNNRLAYLASHESSGDFRPTQQGIEYKEEVTAQIDEQLAKLQQLWDTELPKINEMMREASIDFIAPKMSKAKP